jgi:hypothetical protein
VNGVLEAGQPPGERQRRVLEAAAGAEQRRARVQRPFDRREHGGVVAVGRARDHPDPVEAAERDRRSALRADPEWLHPVRQQRQRRSELAMGEQAEILVAEQCDPRAHRPPA